MSLPIALVHPPHARACEPGPGLLVLAAYLRRAGRAVRVVDANLLVQEALLSSSELARRAEELAARGAPDDHVTSGRRAARKIVAALEALRSPDGYRARARYEAAAATVAEAYRLLSRHSGARLSVSDLEIPDLSPLSTRDLTAAARGDRTTGMDRELEKAADAVLSADPEVIGVSVTYLSQALPSFALAGLLRRRGFRGKLVLGGGLPSCWAPALRPDSVLFGVWDAVVVGAGEAALEALTQGAEGPSHAAPGLLFPAERIWAAPAGLGPSPVCFEPDPEGLPWDRYLAPGPVLPLSASRGCYWRRCAFCPEAAAPGGSFRPGDAESLVRAILQARDAYGIRKLHFTDDALPPALLRRVARKLEGEGVSWYGFVRPERALLDPSFAEELARGGCAMLQLGVESASQRLLDLLRKGTRIEVAAPILANLRGAGIRTFVYLLFGLPSETEEESEATLRWATEHREEITFLNLALMNLPAASAPARDPSAYGVTAIEPLSGENDLALYVGFSGEEGEPRARVRRLLARARTHPDLRPILRRLPPGFAVHHAAFCPL